MKILFAATRKNPAGGERELYEMDLLCEVLGFDRALPDLGLLTVAACTPERFEVAIRDEYLEPIDFDEPCDLVALSAKTSCVTRAYEVAAEFRRRGRAVVLGGVHASLRPDEALEHVDHVVTGEAEELWPRFLADLEAGRAARRYDAVGAPAMDRIPPPTYGGLDPARFLFHQLQTTRGSAVTSRVCSAPDRPRGTFRFKPVGRVVDELRELPACASLVERRKALYFVDDDFHASSAYTKELLEALAELRAAGELSNWSAETTLDVADDEELLDRIRDAGCSTLILGFDSAAHATHRPTPTGPGPGYPEALERIHQRGISIVGNFIVGYDSDTIDVFRDARDFVFENNILYPSFSILAPMPGTALHDEFAAQGRLDHLDWRRYDARHVVFEPAQMTREQLLDGTIWLFEQCYTSDAAYENLVRSWKRRGREGSTWIERQFLRYRLMRSKLLSPAGRAFYRRASSYLSRRGNHGDLVQLLSFLDFAHYAESLAPRKSKRYAEHARMFEWGTGSGSSHRPWEAKRFVPAGG